MRQMLAYVNQKALAYERLPLCAFMDDAKLDARDRLGFVPCLAHFVMTFADIYGLVLRDEPARDRYQELVNAHTYEDGGHWKWYLADLNALNDDPMQRFSDTLRFVWGDASTKSRLLSYRIARLGYGASSLHRLMLVECIEAVGKVSLSHAAPLGRELAARGNRHLLYFGAHHLETEEDHTLEDEGVHAELEKVVLDDGIRPELYALIDEAFAAFTDFSDELLRFAQGRMAAQKV